MIPARALALHLTCMIALPLAAQDDSVAVADRKFRLRGYVKDLVILQEDKVTPQSLWVNQIHNRLNVHYSFFPALTAKMEVRNRIFTGSLVTESPNFEQSVDYERGLMDLSWIGIESGSTLSHTIIDRLNMTWNKEAFTATVGRQRINWGLNLVWNPNDIFNAYNFLDFDYEERPGSDALRFQYSTGGFSSVEGAVKAERNPVSGIGVTGDTTEIVAAGMYKFNHRGYDIQVFGGIYYEDWVAGLGWAGSIGEAGFKLEASYFIGRTSKSSGNALSLSTSFDYSFEDGFYTNFSYLYSSMGSESFSGLGGLTLSQISPKALMPYRHSFLYQISKNFTPIFNAGISMIYSPSGDALILFPSLSYSLSDSWDISGFVQGFFADALGEYSNLGNAYFVRARWSFATKTTR
jgi:hypothetical protein